MPALASVVSCVRFSSSSWFCRASRRGGVLPSLGLTMVSLSMSSNAVAQEFAALASRNSDPLKVHVAKRLEQFETTIFTKIGILASKHNAIKLGQALPKFDVSEFAKNAAIVAIRDAMVFLCTPAQCGHCSHCRELQERKRHRW